jgi:hypothetical protein
VLYSGSSPNTVLVVDLNNDSREDIIWINTDLNTVSIRLGFADSAFVNRVIFMTSQQPGGLDVGDFNRDGYIDVATSDVGSKTICIFQSKGDGIVQYRRNYSTGACGYWVNAGDLNNVSNFHITIAAYGLNL